MYVYLVFVCLIILSFPVPALCQNCTPAAHMVLILDMSGSQFCEFSEKSLGQEAKEQVPRISQHIKCKNNLQLMKGNAEKFLDQVIDWMGKHNGSGLFFAMVGYGYDVWQLPSKKGQNESGVLLDFFGYGSPTEAKAGYKKQLKEYLLDGWGPMALGFREAQKLFDREKPEARVVILLTDGDATSKFGSDQAKKEAIIEAEKLREQNTTVITLFVGKQDDDLTEMYATNKSYEFSLHEFNASMFDSVFYSVFDRVCQDFKYNVENVDDKPTDLAMILVPIFAVLAVLATAGAIAAVLLKKNGIGKEVVAQKKFDDKGFQTSTRTIMDSNAMSKMSPI